MARADQGACSICCRGRRGEKLPSRMVAVDAGEDEVCRCRLVNLLAQVADRHGRSVVQMVVAVGVVVSQLNPAGQRCRATPWSRLGVQISTSTSGQRLGAHRIRLCGDERGLWDCAHCARGMEHKETPDLTKTEGY